MECTARVFNTLMLGLGYEKYAAQGGDWGSITARILGSTHEEHCKGQFLASKTVSSDECSCRSFKLL